MHLMTHHFTGRRPDTARDDPGGFVLIALLAALIPILGLAVAASTTMEGRNAQLLNEMHDQRALLAADAAVERAVYMARSGQLEFGTEFTGTLTSGMTYSATPFHWLTDGEDNDLDGQTDEADEDVVQVNSVGSYRGVTWRIASTFTVRITPEPEPAQGVLPGAIYLAKGVSFQTDTETTISGFDKNFDGSVPAKPNDILGLAVPSPAAFVGTLSSDAKSAIEGIPSTTTAISVDAPESALDLATLIAHAQANATKVFAAGADVETKVGSRASPVLAYCSGDLNLKAGFGGAGVLIVKGKIQGQQWSGWEGIMYVGGDVQMQESDITGALLIGSGSPGVQIQKTTVQYSSEAITNIAHLLPDGWLPTDESEDDADTSAPGTITFAWETWNALPRSADAPVTLRYLANPGEGYGTGGGQDPTGEPTDEQPTEEPQPKPPAASVSSASYVKNTLTAALDVANLDREVQIVAVTVDAELDGVMRNVTINGQTLFSSSTKPLPIGSTINKSFLLQPGANKVDQIHFRPPSNWGSLDMTKSPVTIVLKTDTGESITVSVTQHMK